MERGGVEHGPGQTQVELRVGFGGVDVAEFNLAVGPGEFESAVGEARVLVFFGKADGAFPGFCDAGNHIHTHRFVGLQADGAALDTMGSSTQPSASESLP